VNAKTRRLLREEGGFTLPEMLVTIMLMLVVMSALYSIFDMSLRVFSFGNDKVEAVENARLGLEKMEREIRAAYPYNRDSDPPPLFLAGGFTSNSLTFGNDLNGNRATNDAGEQITYTLSGNSLQRNSQPVVEYVKANGLTFQYLDKSGNATTTETAISRVRIKLDIEIDRGSLGKRTQTLTTDVDLRNRS
jgi:prepilin-type N-terminal cleavage/methylation domain-containing protein